MILMTASKGVGCLHDRWAVCTAVKTVEHEKKNIVLILFNMMVQVEGTLNSATPENCKSIFNKII